MYLMAVDAHQPLCVRYTLLPDKSKTSAHCTRGDNGLACAGVLLRLRMEGNFEVLGLVRRHVDLFPVKFIFTVVWQLFFSIG